MSTAVLAWMLAISLGAQEKREAFARVDPYTKSSPEKVEDAGYASLGPFRLGDDHTTDQVDRALEGVPLIWIETAHFKLGSGLPEYALPADPQERKRIQEELERLSERLADVKPKTKKLDPWLRLHLFALRLEDAYAEFLRRFDVIEADFPVSAVDEKRAQGAPDMGTGPYLGMPSKYAVLIFERTQDLERYSQIFLGEPASASIRRHLETAQSLFYATAAELLEGEYQNDSALAACVVHAVAQNLAAGFRGVRAPLAFAWSEGLGHWFARRVDPRYHFFSGADPAKNRITDEWNWALGVRTRVERKMFPSTEAMLRWTEGDPLEWSDHLVLWSRVDYLMSRDDGAAERWIMRLKEPLAEGQELDGEALFERSRTALVEATNLEPADFDVAWAEWVEKTYPVK